MSAGFVGIASASPCLAPCRLGGVQRRQLLCRARTVAQGSGSTLRGFGSRAARAPALRGSARSAAPACVGPTFRSRCRRSASPRCSALASELRPPGAIPKATRQMPPWPVTEPPPAPPTYEPRGAPLPVESRPLPPPPRNEPSRRYDQPVSLDPPAPTRTAPEPYDFRRPYGAAPRRRCANRRAASRSIRHRRLTISRRNPTSIAAASRARRPSCKRRLASSSSVPIRHRRKRRARDARRPPPLGPARSSPRVTGSVGSVKFTPTATLACPMVSALDQWFATAVQPAAMRWFGQPVAEMQADLRLFLPRHERQSARAHFRTRLRQCARHRVLHARRRAQGSP